MKDRTREAIFNLLGLDVRGKHAVDLFAGTGALGFEALSRGAGRATFVEQHFPTARVVQQNAALLGVTERCRVESGNVFLWATEAPDATGEPWLVFCSPPYAFFVDRRQEMMDLLDRITQRAPPDSLLVVESDARFDTSLLPDTLDWDVRQYPPAVVAIGHKAPPDSPQD